LPIQFVLLREVESSDTEEGTMARARTLLLVAALALAALPLTAQQVDCPARGAPPPPPSAWRAVRESVCSCATGGREGQAACNRGRARQRGKAPARAHAHTGANRTLSAPARASCGSPNSPRRYPVPRCARPRARAVLVDERARRGAGPPLRPTPPCPASPLLVPPALGSIGPCCPLPRRRAHQAPRGNERS